MHALHTFDPPFSRRPFCHHPKRTAEALPPHLRPKPETVPLTLGAQVSSQNDQSLGEHSRANIAGRNTATAT